MATKTYLVVQGDSLWRIASAHHVSFGELLLANPQLTAAAGRDPKLIYPGESFIIPAPKFTQQNEINSPVQACVVMPAVDTEEEDNSNNRINGNFFIAVADRAVGNTMGAFYHYSIQYWQSDGAVDVDNEMTAVELMQLPGVIMHGSVELLRDAGWRVWVYKDPNWTRKQGAWEVEDVSISVIHFSDSSTNLRVLQQGSEAEVQPAWERVNSVAADYGFAEQGGGRFSGDFTHWANSKYQMPGSSPFNNSNTFVRFVIAQAELTMTELGGSHPGADRPAAVVNIYSEQPWAEGGDVPAEPTTFPT